MLLNAKNPAILIGFGALESANNGVLVELAERIQIPVATSGKGKGIFPKDHPVALGCSSIRGARAANTYLRSDIDVLLVAGTDFSEMTSHGWDPKLKPSKALIQIDIDPNEIGKNYPLEIGLVADANATLQALQKELINYPDAEKWDLSSLKKSRQYYN